MKFYGTIGFSKLEEETIDGEGTGVWEEKITEKQYYGDVTRNTIRYSSTEKVNDDLEISNNLSIVADSFAYDNLGAMKYAVLNGVKWKITSIEIAQPRIILSLGSVFTENSK